MDGPFTLAFVGYTTGRTDEAAAYEDAVLPLLADHGARVLFRGRRAEGQDGALPFEVHLLWFPNGASLEAYLADERRQALLERFGDVFVRKDVVVVDVIEELR
jgi:uncharacterized protein (DUF1330 family)